MYEFGSSESVCARVLEGYASVTYVCVYYVYVYIYNGRSRKHYCSVLLKKIDVEINKYIYIYIQTARPSCTTRWARSRSPNNCAYTARACSFPNCAQEDASLFGVNPQISGRWQVCRNLPSMLYSVIIITSEC